MCATRSKTYEPLDPTDAWERTRSKIAGPSFHMAAEPASKVLTKMDAWLIALNMWSVTTLTTEQELEKIAHGEEMTVK